MFIGHLPAGYICSSLLEKNRKRKYIYWGLFGSIFPDFDMFYFYLIDNKQHLHHSYITHIPSFWIAVWSACSWLLIVRNKRKYLPHLNIFFINILLHLFLDTIVGKIMWLFPISKKAFYFFGVPNAYDSWVQNFILHWTFGFEVLLILGAVFIFRKKVL